MPWLSQKSHVRDETMNTRFSKPQIFQFATSTMALVMISSTQGFAAETGKKQTIRPAGQNISGDDFQLTLSTVPYSSDPESDYVRIYCAPGDNHSKKSKADK